jgi:type III pantothenate kinase
MMNRGMPFHPIAVDVGNSRIKLAIPKLSEPPSGFAADRFDYLWTMPTTVGDSAFTAQLSQTLDRLGTAPNHWLVVSVQREAESRLANWVRQARADDRYSCLRHSDLPLKIDVVQPERVGMDRLASAVAVNRMRCADQPAIIVDVGTAITVDVVLGNGTFAGGAILPGIGTSADALHHATAALPRIDSPRISPDVPPIGRSTETAIRSGLVWGSVGAVKELVARMQAEINTPAAVFCTGGAGAQMAEQLGQPVTYVEHLVLTGALSAEPPHHCE